MCLAERKAKYSFLVSMRMRGPVGFRGCGDFLLCKSLLCKVSRKMLTSIAKTTGGFEYAGEYYAACCAFLSGTDPSMPSKALIQPNELNIDRLLKVTGGSSKMHTGPRLVSG
jgi:hypothetical protein